MNIWLGGGVWELYYGVANGELGSMTDDCTDECIREVVRLESRAGTVVSASIS